MINGATSQTSPRELSAYLRSQVSQFRALPRKALGLAMELGRESKGILLDTMVLARQHAKPLILALLVLATVAAALMTVDKAGLELLNFPKKSPATDLARGLSKWGDFQTGLLILAALVWSIGAAGRAFSWRQAAVALVLAATFAGLTANILRFSVGRPRPSAGLPDGIYGPSLKHRFHGFPSAHAATSFGAAGALVVLCPPSAVVVLPVAAAVSWSRLQLRRHHPSDIVVGGGLGLMAGALTGVAAIRRRRARRLALTLRLGAQLSMDGSAQGSSGSSSSTSSHQLVRPLLKPEKRVTLVG